MNSEDAIENTQDQQPEQKVQVKDIMQDIETQGKKWINQFQEAVVDDPLVKDIKMKDVGKVAQQVFDKASELYTPDNIERITQISKQAHNTGNQYVDYVNSFWGQEKEFAKTDDYLHQHHENVNLLHDIPQLPAKFTINETDCANDTCQIEIDEDHSPAVPLIKTGVIDVISKNDKYKFDQNDFNRFGKDSSGLKIYHLNDGDSGLQDSNNGVQTLIYNGRNPLKFYKQKDVLYILDQAGENSQIGPAGSEPIPFKEPVIVNPEISSDGSVSSERDPIHYYDGFPGSFDSDGANNQLPPQKDVSLTDNLSFVIILVLVMIIGYILRKDNSRKNQVLELTRQLNEAKNNQDQTEFSGKDSNIDMETQSIGSSIYNRSIKTNKTTKSKKLKFQNIPKDDIVEEKKSLDDESSDDSQSLKGMDDLQQMDNIKEKNKSKSPQAKRMMSIETKTEINPQFKDILKSKLSPCHQNELQDNVNFGDEMGIELTRIHKSASNFHANTQRERNKSQGNHTRIESFRSSEDSQKLMYQQIPNTTIGLKKRDKRIYSNPINPNMTFKNYNDNDRLIYGSSADIIDVEGTIVHEKIKQISDKIIHADNSTDSNMPKLDSIDSPFGEFNNDNDELEVESNGDKNSNILIQDQEIDELSGEESAKVMLFDTQNAKRKEIILRKMSSNDSFTSISSPTIQIEDQNSSIVKFDQNDDKMKQLAMYHRSMQKQILSNTSTKINFGLNNIQINHKTGKVSIPANFEIPLKHFKSEHANAIKQLQRIGQSCYSPKSQCRYAIENTPNFDQIEDYFLQAIDEPEENQQLIVPYGYSHIGENDSSQKPKLDWPLQEKSLDFDVLKFELEDDENIREISEIEEVGQPKCPQDCCVEIPQPTNDIHEIIEIDYLKSDEKKNQSQIFKNRDQSDLSPIQMKSEMNSSFILADSYMEKSIYQPYQKRISETPEKNSLIFSQNQPQAQVLKMQKTQSPQSPISSNQIQKYCSISEDSPLQNILDNGRFKKKFKDRIKIGEGGFGKVYKAKYHVDQKVYAIKVVRLHILKSDKLDPMIEIYQHKYYRELQAAVKITSENIVRYFNSWFEELDDDDKQIEIDYQKNYIEDKNKQTLVNKKKKLRSKLSSISSGVSSKEKSKLRKCMNQKKLNFGNSSNQGLSFQLTKLKKNQIIKELKEEESDEEGEIVQHSKYTHSTSKEEEKKQKTKRTRSTKKSKDQSEQRSEISKTSKESRSRRRAISISKVSKDSGNWQNLTQGSKQSGDSSSDDSSSSSSDSSSDSSSSDSISKTSKSNSKVESSVQISKVKSSEVSESNLTSIESGSEFSKLTLNNFLKKKQEFQSVNMMIQMEFCTGESLEKYLSDRNKKQGKNAFKQSKEDEDCLIDRQYNLQIFSQMINGMVEIHKNNVLHRDLKPENIFLNKQRNLTTAKIGDFGLARQLSSQANYEDLNESSTQIQSTISPSISPSKMCRKGKTNQTQFSSIAGTEAYMAPEIKSHYLNGTRPEKFNDIEINKKQDIFQLGLILYELSIKIRTNMQKTVLFRKLVNDRTFDEQCPLIVDEHIEYELIQKMTEMDPKNRPSAYEIQQDWIRKWKEELAQTNLKQLVQESLADAVKQHNAR